MGCQSDVVLGDNLTFSVCTHDADTGGLTDAASPPTYRVYEDETSTPILTGTMALLDGANTAGFYSEKIACTADNGFEGGKTYTVYIEATVDGVTGGISYGFTVKTATLDQVIAGTLTLGELLRATAAATAGKPVFSNGDHTLVFRDILDTKDVITVTLDDAGNVLSLTFDLTE